MTQFKSLLITAATAALFITTPAYAGGSGGGGGGLSGGGTSSPRYNPVEDYQAGVSHLQAGEFKLADKKFGKVLKATNRHAGANYFMGLAKVGQDKHKSSVRYFKNAARYDKTLFEAHGELGAAYAVIGSTEKAQSVMADLEEISVECGTCANATRIKAAQNKITAAMAGDVQKTSYLLPPNTETADTQYFASVSLINKGEYQAAFNDLALTTAAAGPHPDVTTYMGYTQRKMGNFDLAKTYYAMALKVDPQHKGANEYLGELYVETGEMDKAKVQLAKLEEICTFGCIEEDELRGWIVDALP